ncbi:type II toxin-antitoxin system VapC family toxin [Jiangella asiatica]|nr:type II toxin-antitoxin system VapC family toxin [Jiangella asiatica]
MADAQIAAGCLAGGARLAIRNGRDFDGTGVPLIDPWAQAD